MEAPEQKPEEKKLSRTEQLLVTLGMDPVAFGDERLPSRYFSHSQYSSYKSCGEYYNLKYVERLKTSSSTALVKGSSVHKGIEHMLLGKKAGKVPPLAESREVLSQEFDKCSQEEVRWEDDVPGLVKDSALKILDHFAVHALPRINPVAIEEGFAKMVGGVPVVGFIDLVDLQPAINVDNMPAEVAELAPTKLVVVDFKTSNKKWSEDMVRNSTQMTLYSFVKGTPHVRVDQLLTPAKGPLYIATPSTRTRQDTAVLEEDIAETTNLIKSGIFPKAEIGAWKCSERMCPFWSRCRGKKR